MTSPLLVIGPGVSTFNPEVHMKSCQTNLVLGLGFLEIHFLVLRTATCDFQRGD